eukprot:9090276-Karenia_brevis.AAC.1
MMMIKEAVGGKPQQLTFTGTQKCMMRTVMMKMIPGWRLHRQKPWGIDDVGGHWMKMMKMMLMMGSGHDQDAVCLNCGRREKPDSAFCGECGSSMKVSILMKMRIVMVMIVML